jgi:hypothetical protein
LVEVILWGIEKGKSPLQPLSRCAVARLKLTLNQPVRQPVRPRADSSHSCPSASQPLNACLLWEWMSTPTRPGPSTRATSSNGNGPDRLQILHSSTDSALCSLLSRRRICRLDWSEQLITQVTATLREVTLSHDDLQRVTHKIIRYQSSSILFLYLVHGRNSPPLFGSLVFSRG